MYRQMLLKEIKTSVKKALIWLDSMDIKPSEPGIKKTSSFHSVEKWPGMVLPATYNGAHCKILLGGWDNNRTEQLASAATYINECQGEDGFFNIQGMSKDSIYKTDDPLYTLEYLNFHISNYSLGALHSIKVKPKYPLKFMDKYLSSFALRNWINIREWNDPWMEGNNIVNLASFYILMQESGNNTAMNRLEEMIEWLNQIQNPITGYWGNHSKSDARSMLEAMAGASHVYHLYFYFGKQVPYAQKIIDSSLDVATSQLNDVSSACLDLDIVDILSNLYSLNHRIKEIEKYLSEKLKGLLSFQNADGGFADVREGTRKFDGWIKGYTEPQGLSNCFATWFRMTTIAMISTILFPETVHSWNFRKLIGMGYFRNIKK